MPSSHACPMHVCICWEVKHHPKDTRPCPMFTHAAYDSFVLTGVTSHFTMQPYQFACPLGPCCLCPVLCELPVLSVLCVLCIARGKCRATLLHRYATLPVMYLQAAVFPPTMCLTVYFLSRSVLLVLLCALLCAVCLPFMLPWVGRCTDVFLV